MILAIIISAVVGLLVGGVGVYLLIRYSKSTKSAVAKGTAGLAGIGGGLVLLYNGLVVDPVPTAGIHLAAPTYGMVRANNGNTFPLPPNHRYICSGLVIDMATDKPVFCKSDTLDNTSSNTMDINQKFIQNKR
jgi:hypothetical protein